jgi:galactose mutarotase-like enzyme
MTKWMRAAGRTLRGHAGTFAPVNQHRIESGALAVTIAARGAEPQSLRHAGAGELLWQAGPAWPKHAPVLFPIVGSLAGDRYEHDGETYTLGRHGFARERDFAWLEAGPAACALRLEDDAQTLAIFPFRFGFDIRYAVEGEALAITYTVRNPGPDVLPASVGAHPAFRWPLADGVAKEAHVLTFAEDEPEPIRRLAANLLAPEAFPTPVRGRELALDPSLFDADAIVMDRVRSTSVRYAAPGTPVLEVAWTGFAQLGLWSKRGGDFLCIEPWYGYASPAGFAGDFLAKPGLMHLAPGEARTFTIRIRATLPGT